MNDKYKMDMLKSLGFSDEWLSSGILESDYLETLYNRYQESEDKNAEHYRWMAFGEYLLQRNLKDTDFLKLYDIVLSEPDLPLQSSMLHELIGKSSVPTNILQKAKAHSNKSLQRKAIKLLSARLGEEASEQ